VIARGNLLKREEAIAIIKEIASADAPQVNWISLVDGKNGFEIHIKPEIDELRNLGSIVKEHNLALKEVNGVSIIYKKHSSF
jgi:hypothetical protein